MGLEYINIWLEHWEPLWLFAVLYKELFIGAIMLYYIRKEWVSSDSLDKKFDHVLGKYIRRLESNHYHLIRHIIPKKRRKRRGK